MNCETCSKYTTDDLLALAAGDITGWRARAMRQHVQACATCASAWSELRILFAEARGLDHIPADVDLREHTWRAIPAASTVPISRPTLGSRKMVWGGLVIAATAI